MAPRAANAPVSRWIVGPRYDQLFLLAAWCVPLLLWAIAVSVPYGLLIALAIFVVLDNSHQVATLPLTVFDAGSRRMYGRIYLAGALAIGSTAIVLAFFPGTPPARLWASLVVYWGAYHIIRQHYGFLRLYQAREKPVSSRLAQAETIALYSGSTFPYLMNLSHGWAAQGPIGEQLFRFPIPVWSAWIVLAIFAASFSYVLFDAAARALRGKAAVSLRLLHIALVVSNFWMALLWVGREDVILVILFITSYHDLQYHAIVWLVGKARARNQEARVLPMVRTMFGSAALFAAAIIAGGLLQGFLRNDFQLASAILPDSGQVNAALFALVTSYSYMHYFFDGKMWKLRQDPRLRVELGLASK
ncbi:MAG TPA: hypothetical protein VEC57_17200 [Candidatus Limnocylindrales bacterium]|nr:hypothetical protein [Candidatus Limnocylindrales bacterium]